MDKKIALVSIVAMAVVCLALIFKGPGCPVENNVPFINTSGEFSKKYVADRFTCYAQVEITDADKKTASDKLAERRDSLFALLKGLDIPAADIEQGSASLSKEYGWNEEKKSRELIGYVARQSFPIHVDSREVAEKMVDLLASLADVEIFDVAVDVKDREAVEAAVVDSAVQVALNGAANYAKSVNGRVGKILSIGTTPEMGVAFAKMSSVGGASAIRDSVEISARAALKVELLVP